jgi:hypothetical protein
MVLPPCRLWGKLWEEEAGEREERFILLVPLLLLLLSLSPLPGPLCLTREGGREEGEKSLFHLHEGERDRVLETVTETGGTEIVEEEEMIGTESE